LERAFLGRPVKTGEEKYVRKEGNLNECPYFR
jgi:hypothetical protein